MMFSIPLLIIIISWLTFVLYWVVSAFFVKKDISAKGAWWWGKRANLIRLLLAIAAILIIISRKSALDRLSIFVNEKNISTGSIFTYIGAILCVAGVGLAILARFHLGRDWSSHPSLKENHELVTSGPYKVIRHPIYTGMLLAILGSAIATIWVWLIMFIVAGVVFVRRVYKEEEIMTKQFPDEYPKYKNRTKALIPFVW